MPFVWQLKITVFCFLASYSVALALELSRLLGRSSISRLVMLSFSAAGLFAHTVYLVRRSQASGLPPLVGSAHDWLLVLAWILVLSYLYFTLFHRDLALGAFLLPVVILLILATYFMNTAPVDKVAEEIGWRRWKMLHASFLVLGMGSVAAGFVSSLMYLVQHRRLRTRHPSQEGWRMPNLETLAQATRWLVMTAFLLLTLGIVSGVVLSVESQRGSLWAVLQDPQVIVGCLLWVMLAGVIGWLLTRRQPTGKQVAWMTISACGLLLLTIVGLQAATGVNHPGIKSNEAARTPGEGRPQ